MRRLIFLLLLCMTLAGCWLVEKQRVALDPNDPTVAALLDEYQGQPEVLKQKLEELLGAQVVRLDEIDGTWVAVLEPPLQEAVEEGAKSFIGKVIENPTVQDTVAAALSAVLIGLGVVKGRSKLRQGKTSKKEK